MAEAPSPPAAVEPPSVADLGPASNGSALNGNGVADPPRPIDGPLSGGRTIACRSCGQPSERGICEVCGEALREMHELSQGLW